MSQVNLQHADCLDVLSRLSMNYSLIVADPPYNIGQSYPEYADKQDPAEYRKWLDIRIQACIDKLSDNGSLWLLLPPWIEPSYGGGQLHQKIIWHYRFGQCMDVKFIPSYAIWYWITKRGAFPIWNPDAILVESDRKSKYDDRRIQKSKRQGFRVPFDVWTEFPRVQGNNKERCPGHPNQLPELMLARIIKGCSNIGDWVIDPFLGTGTTCVVAKALDRNFIGIDLSLQCIDTTQKRLLRGAVRHF
jgi:site-specific DNA-methyltransferase (adenine-specific)